MTHSGHAGSALLLRKCCSQSGGKRTRKRGGARSAMGCDGGTIPKRHELVKGPRKAVKVGEGCLRAAGSAAGRCRAGCVRLVPSGQRPGRGEAPLRGLAEAGSVLAVSRCLRAGPGSAGAGCVESALLRGTGQGADPAASWGEGGGVRGVRPSAGREGLWGLLLLGVRCLLAVLLVDRLAVRPHCWWCWMRPFLRSACLRSQCCLGVLFRVRQGIAMHSGIICVGR